MPLIKQSSAVIPLLFLMIDSADHISGKTGLTPTVTISKAGGSFNAPSGAVTEIANGWYKVAAHATDSGTLGQIVLHATGAGADPFDGIVGEVIAFDPQDATALGVSRLDGTITSRAAASTALTNATWTDAKAGYLDAAVTSRLASAGYTVPPTAAANAGAVWNEALAGHAAPGSAGLALSSAGGGSTPADIADAVWDEALAGHAAAGSSGAALSAAGGAADPLLNLVPGAYASGTAGAALGRIASAQVVVSSPVANTGVITVYRGDDYAAADGRSIDITDSGGTWPDLAGATVMFKAGTLTRAMTVVTPTGAGKKIRLELTAVETLALAMATYNYQADAVLTNGHTVTLVDSNLIVKS